MDDPKTTGDHQRWDVKSGVKSDEHQQRDEK